MDSENGILQGTVWIYLDIRDCINGPELSMWLSSNDAVIAKVIACGFDNTSLTLNTDYLTNLLQRVKIGITFSPYVEVLRDAPF